MKIACLQSNIVWENREANFERVLPWIQTAASSGARMLILPEMYSHGFSMNTEKIAEPRDSGPSASFLVEQAKRNKMWIGASLPELSKNTPRPHNTFLLAGPNGEQIRYQKMHPFSLAKEDEHYQAGNEIVTHTIEGLRCTFFICYDLRFANKFWSAAENTDCYIIIANWPERRREHWRTLLRARAIENQAYVIGVNRVGEGGSLTYAGDSAIITPNGETLVEASREETMLFATVDPASVTDIRRSMPFLADRR